MVLRSDKKQFAAIEEESAGTTPSGSPLDSATNATFQLREVEFSPEVELLDNAFISNSITPQPKTATTQGVRFSGNFDLRGTTAGTFAAGAPDWALFLRCAGFFQDSFDELALTGSVTGGPFRHGELVTGGTSSATGIVVHDTFDGATVMYIRDSSGTWDVGGETLTGDSSGATVSTDSTPHSTDQGYCWFPVSESLSQVAVDNTSGGAIAIGDVFQGATSGAIGVSQVALADATAGTLILKMVDGVFANAENIDRISGTPATTVRATTSAQTFWQAPTMSGKLREDGNYVQGNGVRTSVSFNFATNEPVRVDVTGQGRCSAVGDVAMLTGIAYSTVAPPLWNTAVFRIGDEAITALSSNAIPCVREMSVDTGNTLANRLCSNQSGGLVEAILATRAGTGSMSPEAVPESSFDWLNKWLNGERMRATFNVGTAAGALFKVSMPGMQVVGAASGDRDGALIRDVNFELTGGDLTNVSSGGTLDTVGGDNEFVLTYHTT